MQMRGAYSTDVKLPFVPGTEGCGTVVKVGQGADSNLLGKRVAFYTPAGVYSQYTTASLKGGIVAPLPESVSLDQGAHPFVNPLTVVAMVEKTKKHGEKVLVHTAAASALGKMLIKYAKEQGVEVICVVRREEQVKLCHDAGATHVVNTSEEGYKAKLKAICDETKCKIAFDAIAGDEIPCTPSILPFASPSNLVHFSRTCRSSSTWWDDLRLRYSLFQPDRQCVGPLALHQLHQRDWIHYIK